ncbi:hypothetical protein KF728_18750 [Candidatus Obscuribacterales bacterium]|nr:hypothetical protein [Candidatus Obscuribacterales bacterium]
MALKKRDKGGEERDPADIDASRAARRAARDKALGRNPSENQSSASARRDDLEHEPPRREMPMTGSAREVRRLRRTGPDVAAQVAQINCDKLAAEIGKKRRLLYIALAIVGTALALCLAASVFGWKQVYSVTRFSIIAMPICIAFGMNDLCLYIAKSNPVLARRILTVFSFGNPHTIRTLAWLYIDTGDYTKAEKIIASAVRTIDAKKKLRDYILMHAFLANLRAHVARMAEAEALVREVLTAAEDHDKDFQTDGSAFLLANTLNYAAQLCDQKDKIQDALALSRRAVKLLCDHKKPPADVCLVALSNAGYYCNVLGEYQDALVYLTKAHELATKTNIARDGQWAFILSNLAIANLGIGRSTMCKRALNDAETRAMAPLGLSERPHLYQCWAIYHFANDRLEYALQSYEQAIEYCSMQKPRDSVALLRIIKEYSVLLREVGKVGEASVNEQRVTQIRDTLFVNALEKKDKKSKKSGKKKKELSVPTGKGRFPALSLIMAGLLGFEVWSFGLRVAPFTMWVLFLAFSVVFLIKVAAKYGPTVKEESSQGAISTVVSVLPYVRSIAPEVRVLPQAVSGAIFGIAIAIGVFVNFTSPAPNMVPPEGLLPFEYLRLGDELSRKQVFDKAKDAFELAIKGGEQRAAVRLLLETPRNMPSAEAIDDNARAVEIAQTQPKEAAALWQACIRRYPDFEFPYINLANMSSQNGEEGALGLSMAVSKVGSEDKSAGTDARQSAKSDEAEKLLKKALQINPNCEIALTNMALLQSRRGRHKAGLKYLNRVTALKNGETPENLEFENADVSVDSERHEDEDTSDSDSKSALVEPEKAEYKPSATEQSEVKKSVAGAKNENMKVEQSLQQKTEPKAAIIVTKKGDVVPKPDPKPAAVVPKVDTPQKSDFKKVIPPSKAVSSPASSEHGDLRKTSKAADDDGWETTPLRSVPIKSSKPEGSQKNWLQKAEDDAKAKAKSENGNAGTGRLNDTKAKADKAHADKAQGNQAKAEVKTDKAKVSQAKAEQLKADKAKTEKANLEKALADKAKADKEKARKKRYAERHKDDWMRLSPDDTDW